MSGISSLAAQRPVAFCRVRFWSNLLPFVSRHMGGPLLSRTMGIPASESSSFDPLHHDHPFDHDDRLALLYRRIRGIDRRSNLYCDR